MCEDSQFFQMLKRMIRAGGKRAGEGDEIELKEFADLRTHLNNNIRDAIHQQLKNGKSWSDIGMALGISKQAAYRKFS